MASDLWKLPRDQIVLIAHVILGRPEPMKRDVASYAARHGLDQKVVRGMLVAAMDCLVDYILPENRRRKARMIYEIVAEGEAEVRADRAAAQGR